GVLHGSARFTQDADVVYQRSDDNLERLVRALQDLHPYLRGAPPGLPFKWDVRTLKAGLNFMLTTDAGAIDLLGHIAGGPAFEDLQADSETLEVDGNRWRCLTLEKLIAVKRAAGRPRDLDAIAELERLRERQNP
ncbi:MAG: hypothetical protein ACYCW6_30240, partial [Candidatus Xenobia bacterium]